MRVTYNVTLQADVNAPFVSVLYCVVFGYFQVAKF